MPHLLAQPPFVDGTDLFEQDDRVARQPHLVRVDVDMRGQMRLAHFTGDRRCDHGRAVFVPDVVLNDKYRSESSLFGADHRAEIGVENISAPHTHMDHILSVLDFAAAAACLFFPAAGVR